MPAHNNREPAHTCIEPRCPWPATHGVYARGHPRRWTATNRTNLPHKAPLLYCRWHATVQAVCRNAAQEAPHA
jgi:hypothetical protein